jgi:hypothetical protein
MAVFLIAAEDCGFEKLKGAAARFFVGFLSISKSASFVSNEMSILTQSEEEINENIYKEAKKEMEESIAYRKAQPLGEQVFFNPDILWIIGSFVKGMHKYDAARKQLSLIDSVIKKTTRLLKINKSTRKFRFEEIAESHGLFNTTETSWQYKLYDPHTPTSRQIYRIKYDKMKRENKIKIFLAEVKKTKIGKAVINWFDEINDFSDDFPFQDVLLAFLSSVSAAQNVAKKEFKYGKPYNLEFSHSWVQDSCEDSDAFYKFIASYIFVIWED